MIKAGIIGNGGIARSHLRGYSRLFEEGEVEVVAFCDFRPERLEDEFLNVFTNARKYTDIDEMLKAEQGKLDYIDICLPTYLHAEIAIKAMEAGYDVMSEKPMARTVEQAESMVEASKRTGKRLMIAYCNRFNLAAQTIKEIIDSGEFGKPVSAQFQRHGGTYDILRNGKSFGFNDWFRNYELSGSGALDMHVHDIDVIRGMFGMPKAVTMVGKNMGITDGGYDTEVATYIYDDMFVLSSCDWYVPSNKFDMRGIRVNFERGYVFQDRSPGREVFMKVAEDGTVTDLAEKNVFDPFYHEIKYFAGKIKAGEELDYNRPEESVDSIRMALAAIESADKGGEKINF
ncbi:MAG: Gfo/Idh/MocA family oxidoreductase [Ruminococcaceae bacterium]|nr:Gfo/Idh/MocA family oxidoreductase [Oscillospiraceae bacterium]